MTENPAQGNTETQTATATPSDKRFFWLTVFQYGLIAVVTIIFVVAIAWKLENLDELANLEIARGLITFVITVGTVAIAIMLALTAVMIREFDQRIVVGKEILTILIAVLGTIVGFYYGASTDRSPGTTPSNTTPVISVEPPKVNRSSDGALTLNAKITGGTAPYQYSVRFTPNTIQAVENKESIDGAITAPVVAQGAVPPQITVVIEGKDKNGVGFLFNKDGKIQTDVPSQ